MTNSKPYYIFEVDFFLLFRPTQNAINSLCINHAKNKRNKITILNIVFQDIMKNSNKNLDLYIDRQCPNYTLHIKGMPTDIAVSAL